MTDKQYLNQMVQLTKELENAYNINPHDQDLCNDVVDKMNALTARLDKQKRRHSWFMSLLLFVLFCILFLLLFILVF